MKTTGMSVEVASHTGAQRKIPEHRPNTKRTSGTRSKTRVKKTSASRVDQRPGPGVQIQIGTRYQTERDGEVVSRFTPRTMRMSLLRTDCSRRTPGPGLHPLPVKEGCGRRGFLTALSTRQVCIKQGIDKVWMDR